MLDAPAIHRRRFRFGLRALLATTAVIAFLIWGLQYYRMHREQMAFESASKTIRRGIGAWDIRLKFAPIQDSGIAFDAEGREVGWYMYRWPNAVYFIYGPLRKMGPTNNLCFYSIEVFRLPGVPSHYTPRGSRTRKEFAEWLRRYPSNDAAEYAYASDFLEMIAGNRLDDLGLDYELIYSDTPP